MLSKLIAWGNSREEAIARLRRALDEYAITGIKTNAGLFRRILSEPDFLRAEIHTKWLDEILRSPAPAEAAQPVVNGAGDAAAIAAAVWEANRNDSNASASSAGTEDSTSRWKREGRRQQLDRTP